MTDKEKPAPTQPKNIPKDGQVIMAIMKEMDIQEYEPKTIVQLTEFVYRYATSILEEARMYANNSKKRSIDVEDVRLAIQLTNESTFTTPPPREILLECASIKNYSPLPLVKPHCGLRLPPDRYCLFTNNYLLKNTVPKKGKGGFSMAGSSGVKMGTKPNVGYMKRAQIGVTKQTVTIPKPLTKISTQQQSQVLSNQQKGNLKPKIQISSQNLQMNSTANGSPMDIDGGLKRKREDEGESP